MSINNFQTLVSKINSKKVSDTNLEFQPLDFGDFEFWDDIPDEDSVSSASEKKKIYSNKLNDNILLNNKGGIKASEKDEFILELGKQASSCSNVPAIIKLTPCKTSPVSKKSWLAFHSGLLRKTTRKLKHCNKVRRSITVTPEKCFGPKMASPVNRKMIGKQSAYSKKDSSSTIKSRATNASSSHSPWGSIWNQRNAGDLYQRSRSMTPELDLIPESKEMDAHLLTVMDL